MISLHIVVDNAGPEVLNRALQYLKRTDQETVDIAAGAQVDRGMWFVEAVHAELPDIKIFWRNLDPEDTGILAKLSPEAVYQKKVAPYRAWFQKHKLIFMPDNETSGDDNRIRAYVDAEIRIAKLLHADGLHGAFCRFSTGTIREDQYVLLKPLFDVMQPGDYISPNEYSAQPGFPGGSGGHLERYALMWKAAGRRLPTVIGEAGVAMNYDSGKGYIDAGMTDEAFAQQMLDEEVWYEHGAIDRHLFRVGAFSHSGYQIRDGVMDYLERYYASHQPPVVVTPPETPAPVDPAPTQPSTPTVPSVPVVAPITKAFALKQAELLRAMADSWTELAATLPG